MNTRKVEVIYAECLKRGYTGPLFIAFMDNNKDFKVEDDNGVVGFGRWNANGSLNLIVGEKGTRITTI